MATDNLERVEEILVLIHEDNLSFRAVGLGNFISPNLGRPAAGKPKFSFTFVFQTENAKGVHIPALSRF